MFKDKEEATIRQQEGHNDNNIQSHTCWVGEPQTGEQLYQRSSHTIVKVLNPTSGFPAWGSNKGTWNPQRIWPWGPIGFDYRPFRGLRETDTPGLEGTGKIFCAPRPREQQWPQETEPKPSASVRGPPEEARVGRGLPNGQGHQKVPLGVNPLGVCH